MPFSNEPPAIPPAAPLLCLERAVKQVTEEEIPCGTSRITRWYDGDKLIRQDCEIIVKQELFSESSTGEK